MKKTADYTHEERFAVAAFDQKFTYRKIFKPMRHVAIGGAVLCILILFFYHVPHLFAWGTFIIIFQLLTAFFMSYKKRTPYLERVRTSQLWKEVGAEIKIKQYDDFIALYESRTDHSIDDKWEQLKERRRKDRDRAVHYLSCYKKNPSAC
ncbi:MAG: hypothetical protein JWL92_173 [Candidatus Nomurabacteria bacterium]|nr:hypothetical protein [Candidatus Nomurabacteria bacterium]